MVYGMDVCKPPPPSVLAQRKKAEETLRPPLAPSEKNNTSPSHLKSRKREIASRYNSGITPLTIPPPSSFSTPQRCPSPNIGRTAPSPTSGPPKRSHSAERRRPRALNHRASPPCSPSKTITSKASTPVQDITEEMMQLSTRKQTSGRTPDGLWPSMRSLSGSFLTVSSTKACPDQHLKSLLQVVGNGVKKTPSRENPQARPTSRSFDFNEGASRAMNKPKRALSSVSGEITRTMENEFMGTTVSSRPSRTLSVPVVETFCASPSSSRRRPSTAGIQSSVISYFTNLRKGRGRGGHVEDAHQLRMLENRYLQWRFVNARAHAAMAVQRKTAENALFNAWETTSDVRGSVVEKRTRMELLTRELKIELILKHQMKCLGEWVLLEKEHSKSLARTIETLKSCTLRLPITEGAKANVYATKNAIKSAVDVMQSINSSISQLFLELKASSSAASDLATVSRRERLMLDECRNLLSLLAEMEVKQTSLRVHLIQHRDSKLYQIDPTKSFTDFSTL